MLCCVIARLGVIIIIRGREILGEGVRVAMGMFIYFLFEMHSADFVK